MKDRVIGISGKARSGKDTLADYLISQKEYSGYTEDTGVITKRLYTKYSFADPLKEAVSLLFNIPLNNLYEGDREIVLPEWGLSIRQILQRFGTECMRNNYGQDFWIKKAQLKIDTMVDNRKVIIPDIRFDNEADFCRENGILIHITRPSADGNVGDIDHPSESGISFKEGDLHIINDGSLENLYTLVDYMVKT